MANTNHNLRLPTDVWLNLFDLHWGQNTLRRHIVDHLRQMRLMETNNNTVLDYAEHAKDQAVRNGALTIMDSTERAHYKDKRDMPSGISRDFDGAFIRAEKKWLLNPPMDYATFKWFCENPTANKYRERTTLVIELFPQADFFNLPTDLTRRDWPEHSRAFMAQRAEHVCSPSTQSRMSNCNWVLYRDLTKLWAEILPRLPPQINEVKVICKCPDAPNMTTRPPCLQSGELDGIKDALEVIPGRDVQVEWL